MYNTLAYLDIEIKKEEYSWKTTNLYKNTASERMINFEFHSEQKKRTADLNNVKIFGKENGTNKKFTLESLRIQYSIHKAINTKKGKDDTVALV